MATIYNAATQGVVFLYTQHHFGRDHHNQTLTHGKDTSRTHACIAWMNGRWMITDASRNGTYINGNRIHQKTIPLEVGVEVMFGQDPEDCWVVRDLQKPTSYLINPSSKQEVVQLEDYHTLPGDKNAQVVFFQNELGQWCAESECGMETLEHQKVYSFSGESWMFVQNNPVQDTIDFFRIKEESIIQFELSPDEEQVNARIVLNELTIDLGDRLFNHLLLLLARYRLEEEASNEVSDQSGWISVDQTLHLLGRELQKEIDAYYLNVLIHRLRKYLVSMNPYGTLFNNILERKPGQIRLGHRFFQILKEGHNLGERLPQMAVVGN